MNVATVLRRVAADHAGQVALRLDEQELRYAHLADTAAHLRADGLTAGDRVGIFLPNALEYVPGLRHLGTAHERWVEQVTAVVVPVRPGVTADDVAAWCAANPNLAGILRPRRIEVVDALPRTGSGKLNRPELRKQFR